MGQKAMIAASTKMADTAAGLRISYLIVFNLPNATIPPFPARGAGCVREINAECRPNRLPLSAFIGG
jgi:hypothetical protein